MCPQYVLICTDRYNVVDLYNFYYEISVQIFITWLIVVILISIWCEKLIRFVNSRIYFVSYVRHRNR
jgi:hypothetical protein